MSIHSLRRQLERLKAALPSPSPPLEESPVEEWLARQMRNAISETTLKNTTDEEHFYEFLEELPDRLVSGLYMELNPTVFLPEELLARLFDALPPHVEHWRRLWAENSGAREHRRRWVEEQERLYPRVKTRDNGYGWWLDRQEEYARLGSVYAGFEEEWADFYEEWRKECERPGEPMGEDMREDFVGICFMRESREPLADFTPDIIRDFFEDGGE